MKITNCMMDIHLDVEDIENNISSYTCINNEITIVTFLDKNNPNNQISLVLEDLETVKTMRDVFSELFNTTYKTIQRRKNKNG